MSDVTTASLQFACHCLGLLGSWLGHEPETAVFLSIGIGFYIGSRKICPILPLAGVSIALIPAIIFFLVGHFLLKLELSGIRHCYAILGCGENGIVFSMIGADMIRDKLIR